MLSSKTNFIYEIYKGYDLGKNKSPVDYLVSQFDNFENAWDCYQDIKKECLETSKEQEKALDRYYCYMVKIDLTQKIIGNKDGEKIDNGYFSKTVFANSYTQRPRLHDYMVNIENGRRIDWREILHRGLYEKL